MIRSAHVELAEAAFRISDWFAGRPTELIVQLPWLGEIGPSEVYWNTSHSDVPPVGPRHHSRGEA